MTTNQIFIDFSEDIGKRPYMEDRIIIEPYLYEGWSLFAVCDGHGGSYVCNFLKFHFKDILVQHLKKSNDLVECIHETIKAINNQMNLEDATFQGSTFCGLMINGSTVISINIGDSRAVLGFEDKVVELTTDHKPADPAEEKRIQDAGGFVTRNPMDVPRVNGNLALSRSMGDLYLFPYVISTPDIKHFDMSVFPECYIAIGTDGIRDVIQNEEIIKVLGMGAKSKDIIHIASKKGSSDNMALIVLHKNRR